MYHVGMMLKYRFLKGDVVDVSPRFDSARMKDLYEAREQMSDLIRLAIVSDGGKQLSTGTQARLHENRRVIDYEIDRLLEHDPGAEFIDLPTVLVAPAIPEIDLYNTFFPDFDEGPPDMAA